MVTDIRVTVLELSVLDIGSDPDGEIIDVLCAQFMKIGCLGIALREEVQKMRQLSDSMVNAMGSPICGNQISRILFDEQTPIGRNDGKANVIVTRVSGIS